MKLTLDRLSPEDRGKISAVNGQGALRRRLLDLGLTPGTGIFVRKVAPLGDPIEINIRGYELTIRKSEAQLVEVDYDRT